jgi:hypothetical protein
MEVEVAQGNLGRNRRKSPINGDNLPSKRNKVAGLQASNNRLLQHLQVATYPGSNKDRDSKGLAPARLTVLMLTEQCYAALEARKVLDSCASKKAKSLDVFMRYGKNL